MLQFFIFCIVGVITTVIDFLIFNLLTRRSFGWRPIPANFVSVTAAMTWSFLANWFIVFNPDGDQWLERAGRFILTTGFSAFVLQNMILHFTLSIWKWPASLAISLMHCLPIKKRMDHDFIRRNACKFMAVGTGLVWNFFWYKLFVYTDL